MSKIFQMFVVTHKEFDYKLINNYIPIQVGKRFTKKDLPYISDDTGDNISEKNQNYCELTAIYWLWKNYNLPDYVGISHYRRYFVTGLRSKIIREDHVLNVLKDYDVILPFEYNTKSNVGAHFANSKSGRKKDLDNLRMVISRKRKEYLNDYDYIMNSKSTSYCNMAILSKENFLKYCEWLFPILLEVEKLTDFTGYTMEEKRLYGYLSEFLLNVWIRHNNLKIKYCNVLFTEGSLLKRSIKKIKLGVRSIFNGL